MGTGDAEFLPFIAQSFLCTVEISWNWKGEEGIPSPLLFLPTGNLGNREGGSWEAVEEKRGWGWDFNHSPQRTGVWGLGNLVTEWQKLVPFSLVSVYLCELYMRQRD